MKHLCFFFLFFSFSIGCFAQHAQTKPEDYVRIAFYNVENLFDTTITSIKDDSAFVPNGKNKWSKERFELKCDSLSKVITALGGATAPAIVGLCEVENSFVLNILCTNERLRTYGYQVLHFDSPDKRGIDVAILYRKDFFQPIAAYPIPIVSRFDAPETRDILHATGTILDNDTIHIFVTHFPSRLGGKYADNKRNLVASILKHSIDSVLAKDTHANIIVMGDFNDEASGYPLHEVLKINLFNETDSSRILQSIFNKKQELEGTCRNGKNWSVFDQFIVSNSLWDKTGKLCVKDGQSFIFKEDFLFVKGTRKSGRKPFRTYIGKNYEGGFSDHLPVYMDLIKCHN